MLKKELPKVESNKKVEISTTSCVCKCDMDSCPGSRGFFRGAGETADIREGSTDHGLREPVRVKVRMEAGSRHANISGRDYG